MRLVVAGSLEDHAVVKYALAGTSPDTVVEVGTDGYRALELAARSRPDLVVLDPHVPGLSGTGLVARFKEMFPGVPIVCWTGRPDVDEAAELLKAGASAYLLKEDGPKDLVRHIPSVLEGGLVIAPRVASGLTKRFTSSIQHEDDLTRALAETTTHLQELASTKDKFVANVSHEIRTPVTILKGIAHLLKSGRLSPEEQEQFVHRMDQAVERLTDLVDEILSVADLGQGRLELHPQTCDFIELVDEVCGEMRERYPSVTIDPSAPPSIPMVADPGRLGEAVSQLIDNACRYSPPGGRVAVTVRRIEEGVVFAVTDTGEGLARDVAARAFHEPFVTGEEILRKERAGLGLGLHLARQLVVLHGGTMWADPLPSGGTRLAFCIPVQPSFAARAGGGGYESELMTAVPDPELPEPEELEDDLLRALLQPPAS